MRYKNTTLFLLLFLMTMQLTAQDRHFTLYNFSPLTLNPAYTGSFLGTIRVGGIYRDQYPSFASVNAPRPSPQDPYTGNTNVFVTPSAYADAPILMVRKRDWVGVGLMFYQDKAGTLEMGTSMFMISAAYHLSLNKKSTSVLTLGAQYGAMQRNINLINSVFEDQSEQLNILGDINQGGGGAGNNNNNVSFNDINVGLLFKSKLDKTTNLELGFALSHITTPGPRNNNNPIGGGGGGGTGNAQNSFTLINMNQNRTELSELPMLLSAHGKLDLMINKKLSIAPSFLVQKTRGANFETVLQAPLGYVLNKEKKQKAVFGLGYRFGDALEVLIGYEQDRLKVGASFDMTLTSALNAGVGGFGAFELAAAYIINIYKEPEVKPAVICPRL